MSMEKVSKRVLNKECKWVWARCVNEYGLCEWLSMHGWIRCMDKYG